MQDYFDIFMRFWGEFSQWNPPQLTLYTIVFVGLLSSMLMTRIVAAPPLFSGPISFMILTFAAMLSNFAFREFSLMGTNGIQKTLIFTVLGHAVAGVLLLAIFKSATRTAQK